MLQVYRRHNPARCKKTSRSDYRCQCPIWIQGTINGTRVRRAIKERDWAKAQAQVRRWEVDGDKPTPVARATVSQWKDSVLADVASRHLAEGTARKYRDMFKALEAFAKKRGLIFVQDFTVDELTAFRATWTGDGPRSAGKKTERLRGLFKFAVEREWIRTNPALRLKMPEVKDNPTLPFTNAEMDRIIEVAEKAPHHLLALIYVMRYAGLRISDAAMLRRNSLEGDKLHLHTAKTGTPVRVPLPAYVVKELKAVKNTNPEYFFTTGYARVQSVCGLWRSRLADVFKKAKVHGGHAHRFRDTFAVSLLSAGTPLESVSMLLGHTDIKVTQRHYSPWVALRQELLEKAVYRVNEQGTELG